MIQKGTSTSIAKLRTRLDFERLPRHVAIIMDGNGRWAKQRNFGRIRGHRAGVKAIRQATTLAAKLHLECLTLYAFSTENWNRPEKEINALWQLLVEYLEKEVPSLIKRNIQLCTLGELGELPGKVQKKIAWAREETHQGDGLKLILALNYGSRQEIMRAIKKLISQKVAERDINENRIAQALDTATFPDPDLLIRTSGEMRLSNFLLWQCSYAELLFMDVLWPDFSQDHFVGAIADYQKRQRRFGGL